MLLKWTIALTALAAFVAGPAAAIECKEWQRVAPAAKTQRVRQLVDARLTSNEGKRYTSPHRVAMRRCLDGYLVRIAQDFDGACAQGIEASMNVLDEIFDQYFLSCVQ